MKMSGFMKVAYLFCIALLSLLVISCSKEPTAEDLKLLADLRKDLKSTKVEIEKSTMAPGDISDTLNQLIKIKVETLKINAALLDQRINAIESGATFKTILYQRAEEPWQAKKLADEIASLKSEISSSTVGLTKDNTALHNLIAVTEARRNQTLALLEQRYLVAKYGLFIHASVTDTKFGSEVGKMISVTELGACMISNNPEEIYSCIVELAGIYGLKVKASEPSTFNKWKTSIYTDPFTDEQILSASLKARPGSWRAANSPVLVIRCRNTKLDLFINWKIQLKNYAQTQFRIGKEETNSSSWAISSDGRSAFYPGETAEAMRKLANSDKVAVSVTPNDQAPIIAIFDVTEASSQLDVIKGKCPW
jgi:hypothetical protein